MKKEELKMIIEESRQIIEESKRFQNELDQAAEVEIEKAKKVICEAISETEGDEESEQSKAMCHLSCLVLDLVGKRLFEKGAMFVVRRELEEN